MIALPMPAPFIGAFRIPVVRHGDTLCCLAELRQTLGYIGMRSPANQFLTQRMLRDADCARNGQSLTRRGEDHSEQPPNASLGRTSPRLSHGHFDKYRGSIIDIKFDLNQYNSTHDVELLKRASDLAHAAVDCFCFSHGIGLSVVLETITNDKGIASSILPSDPSLATYCTAFDLSPDNKGANNFDAMFRMIVSEPPIMMALNDLILAITVPHHSSVNCARAIDSIRVLICPGKKAGQAWPIVRQNLNVDEAYLSYITEASKGPRHGDRTFIPGQVTTEAAKRSWIVMNRFLEFRKRGNQPLPTLDFPILLG
jgi:hypothetical protein